jgi:DNA-binding Lrp family transcriptional regulator
MHSPPSADDIFKQAQVDPYGTFGIVRRPGNPFRALSVKHRWEVTRRHPYYLGWWNHVRRSAPLDSTPDDEDVQLQWLALMYLGALGVGSTTVDPRLPFSELSSAGPDATAWLYGTAHPISMGGQLSVLIATLPAQTLAHIGRLLVNGFAEGEECGRLTALQALHNLQDPALAAYPDVPFLSISPTASTRELHRDLPLALKPWRDRPGVVLHRDRSKQVDKYLQVWDRREGWNEGRYEHSAERTFRQISEDLRLSISTVNNRYRSAFELITGHAYSPALWFKIVGPMKLTRLFGDEVGPISLRRPLTSPVPRPVPDAVVSAAADHTSIVEFRAHTFDNQSLYDLLLDVEELLARGKSYSQICRDLEVPEDLAEELQAVYERLKETKPSRKTRAR